MRNYKQFYVLLDKQPGLSQYESKDELKKELVYSVSNGRTESLQKLSNKEFYKLIGLMKEPNKQANSEMDKLRKRVIAAIFGYFKIREQEVDINYVKAVAVRAAGSGVSNFNAITKSSLTAIYNQFLKYQKVAENLKNEEAIIDMDASLLALSGIEISVTAKGEA